MTLHECSPLKFAVDTAVVQLNTARIMIDETKKEKS
jgi:hypothetical protein